MPHWFSQSSTTITSLDSGTSNCSYPQSFCSRFSSDFDRQWTTWNRASSGSGSGGGIGSSTETIAPSSFLGDRFSGAYNIGNMSNVNYSFNWTGNVSSSVPNNFYRFQLSSNSDFNLSLTGMSADADVGLFQAIEGQWRLTAFSQNPGAIDESIFSQLTPGSYAIQVFTYDNSRTSYRLTLSSAGTSIDPGNTRLVALDLGEVSRTVKTRQRDFIGATDPTDYYRFELRESTVLNLSLTGFRSNVNVRLLDIGGNEITRSENLGTANEAINRVLNPGAYFLQVYGAFPGVTSTYNLRIEGKSYANPNPTFNATYGYGLVNAAAAVASALNQPTFADVSDLGGVAWGNDLVKAPEVWARGYTGQGVTVAVIDSGVDITHPDLINNIWNNRGEIPNNGTDDDANGYIDDIFGWNFGLGQNNNNILPGTPFNDHGTHVAGVVAASRNNFGITGVAPDARIMALRLGDGDETGSFVNPGNLATAIRYAVDNGARVVNVSLAGVNTSELRDVLAYASSRNVVVVSAAGNSSLESPGDPAQYAIDYGVAVGAIDIQQKIAEFSNKAGLDSRMQYVVAPGVKVRSTLPGNLYGFKDGTSMSTPYVSGVVALMLSANPALTTAQVRQMLTSTATRLV